MTWEEIRKLRALAERVVEIRDGEDDGSMAFRLATGLVDVVDAFERFAAAAVKGDDGRCFVN